MMSAKYCCIDLTAAHQPAILQIIVENLKPNLRVNSENERYCNQTVSNELIRKCSRAQWICWKPLFGWSKRADTYYDHHWEMNDAPGGPSLRSPSPFKLKVTRRASISILPMSASVLHVNYPAENILHTLPPHCLFQITVFCVPLSVTKPVRIMWWKCN